MPRKTDHEKIRSRLIDGTIEVVYSEGIEGATSKKISIASELNEAYIFKYYEDLKNIYKKAFQSVTEELISMTDDYFKGNEKTVVRLFNYFQTKKKQVVFFTRYYHSKICDEEDRQEFLRISGETAELIILMFEYIYMVDIGIMNEKDLASEELISIFDKYFK